MAKPSSVRQREYEQRCKETDQEAYLQKHREQKWNQHAALKQNSEKYKAYKKKDRLRKKKSSNGTQSGTTSSCKQPLGKAVAGTSKTLPKSPTRKNQVIKSIVSSLSPRSKNNLFTSMKKKLPTSSKSCPSILKTT